ncbi:MAG: acyl-CoA thioester hydrolase [Pirellulaceae bacterium]|jgi:acyl-CoA thioester hydrolase
MLTEHQIEIRVRYQETDGQGHVHHANYLTYFEQGRVEMLRAGGKDYREFEEQGLFLIIAGINVRYFLPTYFDDLLQLTTTTVRAKGVRIVHNYQLMRGDDLIAEGETTVACINREGKLTKLPDWMRLA